MLIRGGDAKPTDNGIGEHMNDPLFVQGNALIFPEA
jgi:hypothetical protein